METNKLTNRKEKFDAWLTVIGWMGTVLFSCLYFFELRDKDFAEIELQEPPSVIQTSPSSNPRVDDLLHTARLFGQKGESEKAISAVTTLWSVCHSAQLEIPEESHEIFAKAVKSLSKEEKRPKRRAYYREKSRIKSFPRKSGFAEVEKPVVKQPKAAVVRTGPPKFDLSEPTYPRSKKRPPRPKKPHPPHFRQDFQPVSIDRDSRTPPRNKARRGDKPRHQRDFPAPPPGMSRDSNRRPGGSPPPPPPPRNPLDMPEGGSPPGY